MDNQRIDKIVQTLESYGERLSILEQFYHLIKDKKGVTDLDEKLESLQLNSDVNLDLLKMDFSD